MDMAASAIFWPTLLEADGAAGADGAEARSAEAR